MADLKKTQILLYNSYLSPQRNAIVTDKNNNAYELCPNLTNDFYLNTKIPNIDGKVIEDHNFIKHDLDLSLKVNMEQNKLVNNPYNYVIIQNSYGAPKEQTDYEIAYGYFILGYKWISSNVIEYNLSMDTLNTFSQHLLNTDVYTDKTNIIREHKDRFQGHVNGGYFRLIDQTSEGISSPKLIRGNLLDLGTTNYQGADTWYLAYKSDDDANKKGITCEVYPSKAVKTSIKVSGTYEIPNSEIKSTTTFYIFNSHDNPGLTFEGSKGFWDEGMSWGNDWSYSGRAGCVVIGHNKDTGWFNDGSLEVCWAESDADSNNNYSFKNEGLSKMWRYTRRTLKLGNVTKYRKFTGTAAEAKAAAKNWTSTDNLTAVSTSGSGYRYINGLESLDRKDTKLVKLIELPYAPFNVEPYSARYDGMNIPKGFTLGEDSILRLENLEQRLTQQLSKDYTFNELFVALDDMEISPEDKHDMQFESKLYHSEFYTKKFIYDSFNKEIRLEDIKLRRNYSGSNKMDIHFYPSTAISSNLMFMFDNSTYADYNYIEDYEKFLVCTRNNEAPIYTNDYLAYIKNGYNYDKKKMEATNTVNWILTGLQVAGSAVSFALSGATGGVSAAAGVSLAVSATATLTNTVSTQIQSEADLNQKINQIKQQAASVAAADDLSLMKIYNHNKLQTTTYELSNNVKESVYNLLRLTGYTVNKQQKPDFNSRRNYNFVQMEPEFNAGYIDYSKFLAYKDDISARFQAGVTVYHNATTTGINWDQDLENWETFIIGR